jgi:hypothetical protein
MIGVSMVLTIALCAVGFTILYTALDGFTTDFISKTESEPTVVAQAPEQNSGNGEVTATAAPSGGGGQQQAQQNDPTPTPEPTEAPTEAPDENAFTPDYQVGPVTVNLRSGPSTADSIVNGLPPATPLEYLEEDAPTEDPEDGERWMRFETEDGLEGWIREIDVTTYEP